MSEILFAAEMALCGLHRNMSPQKLYAHSVGEDRMLAQGSMLQAILGNATDECGLSSFAEGELKLLECGGQGGS
jgi:hypothetical protein